MADILVSDDQMMRAFTKWERDFRENPRAFALDVERILRGDTPEDYGKTCSEYFRSLLIDVR